MFMTGAELPGPLQDAENAPLLQPLSAARVKARWGLSAQIGSLLNGVMLWGKQRAPRPPVVHTIRN